MEAIVSRLALCSCLLLFACTVDKDLGPAATGADTMVDPETSGADTGTSLGGSETTIDSSDTGGAPTTEAMLDGTADAADPELSCRDTIQCAFICVTNDGHDAPTLDVVLGCFLECENPSPQVGADVLALLECATTACIREGSCDSLDSGTGGTSDTDSASSSGGPEFDEACATCIFTALDDPRAVPGGACETEHLACP